MAKAKDNKLPKFLIYIAAGAFSVYAAAVVYTHYSKPNNTYNQTIRSRNYSIVMTPAKPTPSDVMQFNIAVTNSTGEPFKNEDIIIGITQGRSVYVAVTPTVLTEVRLKTDANGQVIFKYPAKNLHAVYGIDVSPAYYKDDPIRASRELLQSPSTAGDQVGPTFFFRVYPSWLRPFNW